MLLWTLTFLDFVVVLLLFLQQIGINTGRFLLTGIVYLVAKFIMYREDPSTLIDLTIAFYMLLMLIFNIQWFITWIFILIFVVKIIRAVTTI